MRDVIDAEQYPSIDAKGFSEPITAYAVRSSINPGGGVRKLFQRELQSISKRLDLDGMPSADRAEAALALREMADQLSD